MIERGRKREGEDEGNRQEEESKEEVMTTGLIKVNLEVRQCEVIISSAGSGLCKTDCPLITYPVMEQHSPVSPLHGKTRKKMLNEKIIKSDNNI